MREERHDVVVVGGGPAGSVTAKHLALRGLDVLLIERNQEIGVPVKCAEGVSKDLEKFVRIDKRWICATVKGAHIYSPDGTKVTVEAEGSHAGYVLERRIFDRFLAEEAARAGATVRVKTAATGIIKENGAVKGISANCMGEQMRIYADVVVAADGVESKVGEWAGLNTAVKMRDIAVCAEFLMSGVEVEDAYCEFFIGDMAPRGYAWVFPKGDGCANVGLGIGADISTEGNRALDFLRSFVAKKFPAGKVLAEIYGAVPLSGPIYETVADGIVLVGDAARQVDPLSGGGILYAMRAGEIAAEVISEACEEKDFSRRKLYEYEKRWRQDFGRRLEIGLKAKEYFLKMPSSRMNKLAHALAAKGTIKLRKLTAVAMLKEFVRRSPSLLFDLAKLIF